MLINQKGEKILNLEKKIDEKTGESKLINKETGEDIKGINKTIDLKTGKEIIRVSKTNIILPKIKTITLIKDPRTKKDILVNEETGEELKNLEIKENKENGKKMIIDKNTLEIKSCLNKSK